MAIFNIASPVIAIAFAFLGIRVLRAPAVPEQAGAESSAPRPGA